MWAEGQVLQSGKYRVIRRIGSGGFGLTYLAADTFFDRKIVIKTPNDTFEADQDYERYVHRFQREGQALAKLEHPNIVSVIDFFEEAGMPCLVMAYVEGETLDERLRNGTPLAEDEAVQIFRKLAMALHQVHQSGIFHCDIHPGNIILQRNGEPVLIDFGSAKLLSPTDFTVTTTFHPIFSPYEQRYSKDKPKATWDIYSLAATLFFAITGTQAVPSDQRKMFGDTLSFSPEAKSTLSPWLCEAILKGMALEEQNRPADMRAWERLLYPLAVHQTVQVPVQVSIVDKPVVQEGNRTSEIQKKTNSRSKHEESASRSFSQKEVKSGRGKYSGFPLGSLSLLLLGNVPTGACLWVLGASPSVDVEAWAFVFAGISSATLTGAVALVIGSSVPTRSGDWVFVLAFALAAAGSFVGAWAAIAWSILVTLVFAMACVDARTRAVTGFSNWVLLVAVAWAWAWVLGVIGSVALAMAGSFTVVVAVAGFFGAYLAWLDARDTNAQWAGVGASAISLAGLMVGLSTTLLNGAAQNAIVVVLCFLQIVLLVISLESITKSLSALYRSKFPPFIILNAACVLGMLGGAVFAWWLSSMNTAA